MMSRPCRLFDIMVVCAAIFAIAAVAFSPPTLILILNGLLFSVACGLGVAYAPIAVPGLWTRPATPGDIAGVAIFLLALSIVGARGLSIAIRTFGHRELVDSHFVAADIALKLMAALMLLWAPNAVPGRLPRRKWVVVGALVALAIFLVFALSNARVPGFGAPPVLPHG